MAATGASDRHAARMPSGPRKIASDNQPSGIRQAPCLYPPARSWSSGSMAASSHVPPEPGVNSLATGSGSVAAQFDFGSPFFSGRVRCSAVSSSFFFPPKWIFHFSGLCDFFPASERWGGLMPTRSTTCASWCQQAGCRGSATAARRRVSLPSPVHQKSNVGHKRSTSTSYSYRSRLLTSTTEPSNTYSMPSGTTRSPKPADALGSARA